MNWPYTEYRDLIWAVRTHWGLSYIYRSDLPQHTELLLLQLNYKRSKTYVTLVWDDSCPVQTYWTDEEDEVPSMFPSKWVKRQTADRGCFCHPRGFFMKRPAMRWSSLSVHPRCVRHTVQSSTTEQAPVTFKCMYKLTNWYKQRVQILSKQERLEK